MATIDQGYIDIGKRCGLAEPSVEIVQSWLACRSQRWLLIIDNADNPENDYLKYLPPGGKGNILITTRNPEMLKYSTVGSEDLQGLEPNIARELLLKAATIPESLWKDKFEAALAAVKVLGLHTLAIVQAGAFIGQGRCTLEQYPAEFRQRKDELLKFNSLQLVSEYQNVYTTFEVSAQYLLHSESQEHTDALELLHTIAFMHNNSIHEGIFEVAFEKAMKLNKPRINIKRNCYALTPNHISMLPEFAQGKEPLMFDPMRWRRSCSVLKSLSLISVHEQNGLLAISMHPLVHTWAKERLIPVTRCKMWQSAAAVLAFNCAKAPIDHLRWDLSLLPHIQACVGHETELYTRDIADLESAKMLLLFTQYLYDRRDYRTMDTLLTRSRSKLEDFDRAAKEIGFKIRILMSGSAQAQRNYAKAKEILEEAYEVYGKFLPQGHNDYLQLQGDLAHIYAQTQQTPKAVELCESNVRFLERLAEDDPQKLNAQCNLAHAYLGDGRTDEALHLMQHVVELRKKLPENDIA